MDRSSLPITVAMDASKAFSLDAEEMRNKLENEEGLNRTQASTEIARKVGPHHVHVARFMFEELSEQSRMMSRDAERGWKDNEGIWMGLGPRSLANEVRMMCVTKTNNPEVVRVTYAMRSENLEKAVTAGLESSEGAIKLGQAPRLNNQRNLEMIAEERRTWK